MKYLRHFLEEEIGETSPADFTTLWAPTGFSSAVASASSKFIGDRELGVGAASTDGERAGIVLDPVEVDADRATCQVLTSMRVSFSTPSHSHPFVGARISGGVASWAGYFADLRCIDDEIAIVKGAAGVGTDLDTVAFSFASGTRYKVRFDISGGATTTIRIRVWEEGDVEPASWTLEVADSSSPITAAGSVVVGQVREAGLSTLGLFVPYLSIGTDGDDAPAAPVTWQEYLDFLALQGAIRCLLVEADALGQANDGTALDARVGIANMPFISKPEDRFPNICYEEIVTTGPTIRRRMGEALQGPVTLSFGNIDIKNEVAGDDQSGRLDGWSAWNFDGRDQRLLLGHPSWRRADFKTVFLGASQGLRVGDNGSHVLDLRGPEAIFKKPLVTDTIGGEGANSTLLQPYNLSTYFNATALVYDENTLRYTLGTGGFALDLTRMTVRAGGVSMNYEGTISSVDAGTDTLSTVEDHGLLVGATWIGTGSLPSPLGESITYYVAALPSSTEFQLSETPDGPVIDLTTTDAGGTFVGRLYDVVDGYLKLLASPSADVTVDQLDATLSVSNAIATVINGGEQQFTLDAFHGETVSEWVGGRWPGGTQRGAALEDIATSAGASWLFSREGTYYLIVLDTPTEDPADWAVSTDDILSWRVGDSWFPTKPERLGYMKNQTVQGGGDLLGAVTDEERALYGRPYSIATENPSYDTLDNPDYHLLAPEALERETLLMDGDEARIEANRRYLMRAQATRTYLFDTDAWALAVEIGDSMDITYPRDGFQAGKKAIVVGVEEDLDNFRVRVEVWAPVTGNWPIVTAAQPFVSEAYF